MSTLNLTIKSARTQTDLQGRLKKSASLSREVAKELSTFFQRAAVGLENVSLDLQTGSADPVAASATATLVYASVAAADTITIGGTVLTCTTAAPANQGEFRKETDLATLVANLVATINAHTTLGAQVTASSATAGVVTITCKVKGVVGNAIAVAKSSIGITLSASALAGGTGGATDTANTYSLGL